MGLMGRGQHDHTADAATGPSVGAAAVQTTDKGGAACH